MKNLVIVGATSCIAHNCARLWLNDQFDKIFLLGRNQQKLDVVKLDLEVRLEAIGCKTQIVTILVNDFCNPLNIEESVNKVCEESPHTVLIAQGTSKHSNQELVSDLTKLKYSIEINAISPILYLEKILNVMLKSNEQGRIGVIGSVAGDRGRLSNYVYGSSKGLIEKYVQGIHHRLGYCHSNVSVTLIKPGPTASPMTLNYPHQSRLADVQSVSKSIVHAIKKKKNVIYVPYKWRIIMALIRILPNFVFCRFNI